MGLSRHSPAIDDGVDRNRDIDAGGWEVERAGFREGYQGQRVCHSKI